MVTPFNILTPGNIRFGRGQARSAAPWLAQYDAPVLLVHGATKNRAQFLLNELTALHLQVSTFAIANEPTLDDIERGVRLARERGVGAVAASAAARSLMPVKPLPRWSRQAGLPSTIWKSSERGEYWKPARYRLSLFPQRPAPARRLLKTRSSTSPSSSAKSACATIACCRNWRLSIRR